MQMKRHIRHSAVDAPQQSHVTRSVAGFSLTEMIVTMLILALAATLMATGIPVAVDTYHKTVNSANAQVALSTTITVLRSEFGSSTKLEVKGGTLYYRCSEGSWARVSNPEGDEEYRGLVKRFYAETPEGGVGDPIKTKDKEGNEKQLAYPIISNSAVTEPLRVQMGGIAREGNIVKITNLRVFTESDPSTSLASVASFEILVPFAG